MALVITPTCQSRLESLMGPQDANGCRRWLGSYDEKGYPRFIPYPNNKFSNLAHRVIWQVVYDREPGKARITRSCGNRWCVEPDHIVTLDTGNYR